MSSTVVACVQLEQHDPFDRISVLGEARQQVIEAGPVDLIVLPEMWSTGYFAFDSYSDLAQHLDGPLVTWARELAVEAGTHLHLGSFLERVSDGGLANTSVMCGPDGSILGTYRKVHVFGYDSREAQLVQGGDEVVVVDIDGVKVGLAICYDLRFPELFRHLVDLGAECVVVPATWPMARRYHWETLIRARAIENLCVVVACNAAGVSLGVELAGASAIVGPWGEPLAVAAQGEATLSASIDLAEVRRVRSEFPALEDRREWLQTRPSVL